MTADVTLSAVSDPMPAEDMGGIEAQVARIGALPHAPLAMPKQRLEHGAGLLRRVLRLGHPGAARIQG